MILNYTFMNEELTTNNFDNEKYNKSTGDIDYKNLINRLKEINTTIDLLKKNFLR